MRATAVALPILLALAAFAAFAASASAATVSEVVTGTSRVVTILGDASQDYLDVELEDPDTPGSDIIVYGTEAITVAMGTTGCAVNLPGEIRCSAPAGFAGRSRVVFRAYEGDDRLRISPGMEVRFTGGPGDDRLETEPAQTLPVVATGDAGDDTFFGGRAADRLDGGAGADRLEGFAGDDRLSGGSGEDVLVGGAGRDRLDCGASRGDRARADRRDRTVRGCEHVSGRPARKR